MNILEEYSKKKWRSLPELEELSGKLKASS
jgi:hypothetical protein